MSELWIDDDRPLPSCYDAAVTTVDEAIAWLTNAKARREVLVVVSFDYDAHRTLPLTFMPVAHWMSDNDYWPTEIRIHTYNYWEGRPTLLEYFTKHAPPPPRSPTSTHGCTPHTCPTAPHWTPTPHPHGYASSSPKSKSKPAAPPQPLRALGAVHGKSDAQFEYPMAVLWRPDTDGSARG